MHRHLIRKRLSGWVLGLPWAVCWQAADILMTRQCVKVTQKCVQNESSWPLLKKSACHLPSWCKIAAKHVTYPEIPLVTPSGNVALLFEILTECRFRMHQLACRIMYILHFYPPKQWANKNVRQTPTDSNCLHAPPSQFTLKMQHRLCFSFVVKLHHRPS